MSALARLLLARGAAVSGSDRAHNPILDDLRALGAQIHLGHSPRYLRSPDVVVYSTAIPKDNPELARARELGIPIWHRARMLARLVSHQQTIAVTGTHGKTTTAALVGAILAHAGLDPTVVVGGILRGAEVNAIDGAGRFAVVEACESDRSFLLLDPKYVIITNIDREHLDQYGTFERILDAFAEFVALVPPDGHIVACAACPYASSVAARAAAPVTTYGLRCPADYRADDIRISGASWSFEVIHRADGPLGRITIPLPGEQYINDALAAVALSRLLGLSFADIASAVAAYRGTHRRFEILGESSRILVVDDYAHHPTEIIATLRSARQSFGKRIVAVFQPHLYSRTRLLLDQFATAFADADFLVLTDIYGAREEPPGDFSGEDLFHAVARLRGADTVRYVPDLGALPAQVRDVARPGDLVLFLGAGDIYLAAHSFFNSLAEREEV